MVTRVPLLGMVVAVALLLGENLGANAYVAAKQREADRSAEVERARGQQASAHQLLDEIQRRDKEHIQEWSPSAQEVETLRRLIHEKQLEIAQLRLEAEKLRSHQR